ncbi:VCBS repeat-containing protein, partial [Rhodobiaceae bacterium]|nr:VCBS repeat-containing protein [Rhodobiaceae bacterium]
MTNNYTIEKSIVTIPYVSNRDDRTVLFTDAGTINKVVATSNEGTVYFTKNSTEHIILTGSWFDEEPEVSPLHFIKENGKWILNNTEDLTLGYINGPKFLNDEKDVVFPDQGLEVGSPPFAGNHIRIASIDENNSIVWTQVSEKQAFYHCIAIHDIDNNGLNDILAVSFDEFFIWKQTEEDVFEQTNIINAGRMSAIGIADLDGDNKPEMILGSYFAAFGYKTEFTIYSDNLEDLTTADELVPIFTYTLEDQSMGIESFKFDDFDNNG